MEQCRGWDEPANEPGFGAWDAVGQKEKGGGAGRREECWIAESKFVKRPSWF